MAKYVNILFFDTLGALGENPIKLPFARNYLLFHPLVNLKKKGISLISKIRIQYPLFRAIN